MAECYLPNYPPDHVIRAGIFPACRTDRADPPSLYYGGQAGGQVFLLQLFPARHYFGGSLRQRKWRKNITKVTFIR